MGGLDSLVASPVGFVANTLTIIVLIAGLFFVQRRVLSFSLRRNRRIAFRQASAPTISDASINCRINALLENEAFTVPGEMEWLLESYGRCSKADHSLPLCISPDDLASLARGYELDAARLNSRVLLSANQVPLVEQSIRLSTDTARYLRQLASGTPVDGAFVPSPEGTSAHIPHRGVTVRPHVFPDRQAGTLAYDLVVSYRSHLTAPERPRRKEQDSETFNGFNWLNMKEDERLALENLFSSGHLFDGYLPRLVRWERQHDAQSGRSRIHLALAACSYSAVILDHYPAQRQVDQLSASVVTPRTRAKGVRHGRDVSGVNVGLLTLSLVPVTTDGYIVLALRSRQAGSHADLFGPAVSGNLELHPRDGEMVDTDTRGILDPRRALAREAREELGLSLEPENIWITGLTSFDAPTERGTNVLLSTTMLPFSLAEIAQNFHQADLVEGRWEVGAELLGIRIPRNKEDQRRVEEWLLNSPVLTPHASAAALASLSVLVDTSPISEIPVNPGITPLDEHLMTRLQIW